MPDTLTGFRDEVKQELLRIMDYWIKYTPDKEREGFYGRVDKDNVPDKSADKGIVVTSRILWTFSAAHQLFPNKEYPVLAKRAYDYLIKYFIDSEYGGVYWSVAADGSPKEIKKQLYGHSFAVYSLSEYYKITKDQAVLKNAIAVFSKIAEHAYDKINGGYVEAFERDWQDTTEYILSKGEDRKSMNTHLHLLEAFTNLYRVWKDESSKFHLKHSIEMMLKHIIDAKTYRMTLFFTNEWKHTTSSVSYGHDIEASWLLWEAAEVLGDEELIKQCRHTAIEMAKAAIDGLAADGAINYEYEPATKHLKDNKDWWPQAEAMVGFFNAYQLTGKVHFLEKSEKVWEFIKKYLIDYKNGEWFGAVDANHKVTASDKMNFWKGPYHNGRSCMEIWQRMGKK